MGTCSSREDPEKSSQRNVLNHSSNKIAALSRPCPRPANVASDLALSRQAHLPVQPYLTKNAGKLYNMHSETGERFPNKGSPCQGPQRQSFTNPQSAGQALASQGYLLQNQNLLDQGFSSQGQALPVQAASFQILPGQGTQNQSVPLPGQGAHCQGLPTQVNPNQGLPGQGTTNQGLTSNGNQGALGQGILRQGSPNQSFPGQGTPHQGLSGQLAQNQCLPPQGTPIQRLPGQGAPNQGLPGQGTPNQGLQGQGIQNQRLPGQGAPNQGLPGQGTPNQGLQGQGIQNQGLPGQGAPNQRLPGQGALNQGLPGQGSPNQGLQGQGTQNQVLPGQGAQSQGLPGQGIPNQRLPRQGAPNQGLPGQGSPNQGLQGQGTQYQQGQGVQNQGLPGQGTPNQGLQGQGTQNQVVPGQGTPNQRVPGQGTPNQGLPGQGFSNQGLHGQGTQNQGLPGQGMQNEGLPGQGTQAQRMPGEGASNPALSNQGTPNRGLPGQETINQVLPEQPKKQDLNQEFADKGTQTEGPSNQSSLGQELPIQDRRNKELPVKGALGHNPQFQDSPSKWMLSKGSPGKGSRSKGSSMHPLHVPDDQSRNEKYEIKLKTSGSKEPYFKTHISIDEVGYVDSKNPSLKLSPLLKAVESSLLQKSENVGLPNQKIIDKKLQNQHHLDQETEDFKTRTKNSGSKQNRRLVKGWEKTFSVQREKKKQLERFKRRDEVDQDKSHGASLTKPTSGDKRLSDQRPPDNVVKHKSRGQTHQHQTASDRRPLDRQGQSQGTTDTHHDMSAKNRHGSNNKNAGDSPTKHPSKDKSLSGQKFPGNVSKHKTSGRARQYPIASDPRPCSLNKPSQGQGTTSTHNHFSGKKSKESHKKKTQMRRHMSRDKSVDLKEHVSRSSSLSNENSATKPSQGALHEGSIGKKSKVKDHQTEFTARKSQKMGSKPSQRLKKLLKETFIVQKGRQGQVKNKLTSGKISHTKQHPSDKQCNLPMEEESHSSQNSPDRSYTGQQNSSLSSDEKTNVSDSKALPCGKQLSKNRSIPLPESPITTKERQDQVQREENNRCDAKTPHSSRRKKKKKTKSNMSQSSSEKEIPNHQSLDASDKETDATEKDQHHANKTKKPSFSNKWRESLSVQKERQCKKQKQVNKRKIAHVNSPDTASNKSSVRNGAESSLSQVSSSSGEETSSRGHQKQHDSCNQEAKMPAKKPQPQDLSNKQSLSKLFEKSGIAQTGKQNKEHRFENLDQSSHSKDSHSSKRFAGHSVKDLSLSQRQKNGTMSNPHTEEPEIKHTQRATMKTACKFSEFGDAEFRQRLWRRAHKVPLVLVVTSKSDNINKVQITREKLIKLFRSQVSFLDTPIELNQPWANRADVKDTPTWMAVVNHKPAARVSGYDENEVAKMIRQTYKLRKETATPANFLYKDCEQTGQRTQPLYGTCLSLEMLE